MHPLPIRIWHWVNAFAFILLILTGAQIKLGNALHFFSFQTAVNSP